MRRLRRAAGVTCVVVGGVVWVKVLLVLGLSTLVSTSWVTGDHAGAGRYAQGLLVANVLEPHKALYDSGTALAAQGELVPARSALVDALEQSPPEDECVIRRNLALVLEGMAQSARDADDAAGAAARAAEGLAIVQGASAACQLEQLAGLAPRLAAAGTTAGDEGTDPAAGDSEGEAGEGEIGETPSTPTEPPEVQQALDELEGRMTAGQAQEDASTDLDGDLSDQPVDVAKPW